MSLELKCNICNKQFLRKYYFDNHLCKGTIVDSFKPYINEYKCIFCSKVYQRNDHLDRHLFNTKSKCYKNRISNNPKVKIYGDNKKIQKTIIKNKIIYSPTYIKNQNNIQNQTNNISIKAIIEKIVLSKDGEETISHITKDVMLKILDINKKPKRKKINQNTRIKIAARQLWKCNHCKMLFNEGGWDINHILRVAMGGTNRLSNLEALCKNCHGVVTANERIRDGF